MVAKDRDSASAELPGRDVRNPLSGGHNLLDDGAAKLLAQVLGAKGAEVTAVTRADLKLLPLRSASAPQPSFLC